MNIIKIFNQLNKCKNIAARAATEAVKRTAFGINRERRGFFVMKRAKSDEADCADERKPEDGFLIFV